MRERPPHNTQRRTHSKLRPVCTASKPDQNGLICICTHLHCYRFHPDRHVNSHVHTITCAQLTHPCRLESCVHITLHDRRYRERELLKAVTTLRPGVLFPMLILNVLFSTLERHLDCHLSIYTHAQVKSGV